MEIQLEAKSFLTLGEASKFLSRKTNTEVSEADLLQFSIDKSLVLSIDLSNHAYARLNRLIESKSTPSIAPPPENPSPDQLNRSSFDKKNIFPTYSGTNPKQLAARTFRKILIGEEIHSNEANLAMKYANYEFYPVITGKEQGRLEKIAEDCVSVISGVWDLPMIGCEMLDIKQRYFDLIGGPQLQLVSLEGTWLKKPEENLWAELQLPYSAKETKKLIKLGSQDTSYEKFYPSPHLPKDALLVVRTSELQSFLNDLAANIKSNTEALKFSPNLHPNTSPQLLDLLEANDKFWKNYDPEDTAETAPIKGQVVQWFMDRGYARTLAEKMDTILRDGRYKPGGRPENP